MSKLLEIARKDVVKHYKIKKLIFNLLKTPLFTKNPFYIYFYNNDVKKKTDRLSKKPHAVIIENTNNCNISCVFCAHEQQERQKGLMPTEAFEDIVNQCAAENIENVLIHGFGEPLLDKNYINKVKFTKDKGIKFVHCVSNGILLNEQTIKALIEAKLDFLSISIDAATSETYGHIHRVPNSEKPSDGFDAVVQNMSLCRNLKKNYNVTNPTIQVRFKDFELNKGELNLFVEKFSSIADEINIYMNITNWPGSGLESSIPKKLPMLKFPCYNLWSTLFVNHDGKVPICCQDYDCQVQIGDLRQQSLMDIWHGEKLKKLRKLHLQNRFDEIPICKECVVNSHYVAPWWTGV